MTKNRVFACLALWCASLLATPFFATNTVAATSSIIKVTPRSAWIHWLPNKLPAAGYLTLQNPSSRAITVVSASSPDYELVTFQRNVVEGNTNRAVKINNLVIPANSQVALTRGGYHLSFERPTRAIAIGDNIRVVLLFSTGESVEVRLPVRTSAELY